MNAIFHPSLYEQLMALPEHVTGEQIPSGSKVNRFVGLFRRGAI